MKTVRAKFKVQSVTNYEFGKDVTLNAICGKEGENADFTKATPLGNIKISISSGVPAAEFFEPGKEVYVDFTSANN